MFKKNTILNTQIAFNPLKTDFLYEIHIYYACI